MKSICKLPLLVAVMLLQPSSLIQGAPEKKATYPPAGDIKNENRLDWWREAKFEIFIHWGLYAIPGKGEWVIWDVRDFVVYERKIIVLPRHPGRPSGCALAP